MHRGSGNQDGSHPKGQDVSFLAAIDPGTSGGIAWLTELGEVKTCSMANRGEFIDALHRYCPWSPIPETHTKIFIEHVTGYIAPRKPRPGEGKEFDLSGSGFAMFNFGKSAGICFGICEAFSIKPVEVSPKTWQAACFAKKSGSRADWKNELKRIAQMRYPNIKATLQNCDALLLLSYATLVTKGGIQTAP